MDIPAPRIPKTATEFEQKLELLQAILEDEQKRKALVRVTGKDAQEWLDLLQLLAEYPDVPKALRSSIFSVMIRLSRNSGLYPTCLTIQNVEKLGKRPEGGGSFGDVWKGKIGRTLVCIKVIRAFSVSEIETLAKDYMQEAIVWRQLNHKNLLPFMGIFYLDDDHEQLCLVSPWMTQGNLVQFLKRTPPALVDHQSLVEDVACGLTYLHDRKIVHGDLKGVNILVSPELRACIGDFGLSRISDTQRLFSQTSRSKGTTRWLSPELMRPGPNCVQSRESDMYAYGCVCYEVFAGQVPFAEIPEAAVLFEVLFDKKHPTRPDDSPKLLDPMWDIMVKCWDANPLDRPIIAEVMNQIRVLNSKHNRESEADNEWSDPQYTQVWNDVELYPLDPPAPPADPPAARPAWRAVYPRSSRKKRREAASPPPPLRIDLPPPLQIDPRTQHSWAQWQPDPMFLPTPPDLEPTLLVPESSNPGLFGPRSPRGSRFMG